VGRGSPEAPILRRTRLRLIAWSAGSTLVMLVVLGIAIYVAAATSLSAAGVAQLQARVDELSQVNVGTIVGAQGAGIAAPVLTITSDPSQPGLVLGGAASGTIGFVMMPGPGDAMGGGVSVATPVSPTGGLAFGPTSMDAGTQAAIAAGQTVVRETTIGSAPVRVMAAPVPGPLVAGGAPMTAVVIGDRTAELDTLRTLLIVLLGGGVAALAASVVVGYVYAGRALVPIRESLQRQREFAADASHELRTPLAITRAAIAELRRGRSDPATVDRALDDLDAGATRLELLVDDLLLLARTDADAVQLTQTDTDLALATAEATEALEAVAAAAGVRLVLDVEPAPVHGDEARLRQLAGILVDNAIKHSPSGGRVTVTVRPGARLTVEDEGPGIDPANLETIFERFWRAPGAPAGGTGLGLAIARWIAERHGGSIRAENRAPGTGARFDVRVPQG
jgi:signal transduction histidine kinase